jgi:hypothetical protein
VIEIELRKVLVTIPELQNKVFMLTAPKATQSPYAAFTLSRSEPVQTLDGPTENRYISFDINIYSKDAIELKTIAYKAEDILYSLEGTTQGAFYIQSVNIYMSDFYDSNVEMFRAVLDLEIFI